MRSVLTKGDLDKIKAKNNIGKNTEDPPSDDRLSAISKFIPGEAVAIFLGTFGLFEGALETTPVEWFGIFMFFFCLAVAMFIAYYKVNKDEIKFSGINKTFKVPNKWIKVVITTVAFVIWAFNVEGFVAIIRGTIPAYDPLIGGMLILVYTTLVPLIYIEASKP